MMQVMNDATITSTAMVALAATRATLRRPAHLTLVTLCHHRVCRKHWPQTSQDQCILWTDEEPQELLAGEWIFKGAASHSI